MIIGVCEAPSQSHVFQYEIWSCCFGVPYPFWVSSLQHVAFCAKPPLNRDICWHLTLLFCQHKALFLAGTLLIATVVVSLGLVSLPDISRNKLFCNFSKPKGALLCNMYLIDKHHKIIFTATSSIKPQKPKTSTKNTHEHSFANKERHKV